MDTMTLIKDKLEIGTIKNVYEIGYKARSGKCMWHACIECGKERWVQLRNGQPKCEVCHACACKKRRIRETSDEGWKNRQFSIPGGYLMVKVSIDDFFYPMSRKCGYVLEHRLVMAKHLGRCLQDWEKVHHRNGIKDDNRLKNLELTTSGSHTIAHSKGYRDGYRQGYIDGQNERIEELLKQIKLLQWQLKESVK